MIGEESKEEKEEKKAVPATPSTPSLRISSATTGAQPAQSPLSFLSKAPASTTGYKIILENRCDVVLITNPIERPSSLRTIRRRALPFRLLHQNPQCQLRRLFSLNVRL